MTGRRHVYQTLSQTFSASLVARVTLILDAQRAIKQSCGILNQRKHMVAEEWTLRRIIETRRYTMEEPRYTGRREIERRVDFLHVDWS